MVAHNAQIEYLHIVASRDASWVTSCCTLVARRGVTLLLNPSS